MNISDAAPADLIEIEIVYARAEEQVLIGLKVPIGSTIEEAVRQSGLLDLFPEIDLAVNPIGIFGSVSPLQSRLRKNDRVEIYRPLRRDPKDTRRLRAAKK